MPTYKNNSNIGYLLSTINNMRVVVDPGETIETNYIYNIPGIDLILDTPYFNPVSVVSQPTSTGAGDDKTITLDDKTNVLEVFNNSNYNVTIFMTALANTPGLIVPAGTLRNIRELYEKIDTIIIQFDGAVTAGELIITELEEVA